MTTPRSIITQAELHEWFGYESDTGLFRWKHRPYKSAVQIGDLAGSAVQQHGRERHMLWLKGRRIYASRAAWIYAHGDIPDTVLVDHKDGDTLNDRIDNLRLASTAQNTWNRVQRFGSQYKLGVSKGPRGRYKARVQLPTGEKLSLGTWASEDEAHAAYMGAAAILHSEFWVGLRRAADVLDFTKVRSAG